MRSIKQIKNIKGKTVLLRVDFNVPIKNGRVEDDFKIKKVFPTINFLLKKGGKVILLSHHSKKDQSLASIQKYIAKIFPKGRVELLENLRFNPGEEKNDPIFVKHLAGMGDIYVNDAFPSSHRVHASIVGITKYLPSYAGFQILEEVKNLSRAFKNPKRPFLFILGGAKFSTKIPLIEKYLKLADYVFVGGALANNFLKARGYEVGESLVDEIDFDFNKILNHKKLILPTDVVVKNVTNSAIANFVTKKINEVAKDETILDIGNETVEKLALLIKKSKFILWNGPLGKYEAGGGKSTKKVLKLVADSKAESIIGGGDTVALISEMKIEKKFSFVSTGGGATLDFLANGTLPGIKVLL